MLPNHRSSKDKAATHVSNWVIDKLERRQRRGFEKRLHRCYREPFDLLDRFIRSSRIAGEQHQQHRLREAPEDVSLTEALALRLHARACLLAGEIQVLVTNGYASGAMARWRSLHEVAATSAFISKHGEHAARAYLDHADFVTNKRMNDYARYVETFELEPLDMDLLLESNKRREELIEKYGRGFRSEYGWIAWVLGLNGADFQTLARDLERESWKPPIGMANDSIHAGARGFIFDLGNPDSDRIMLAGPSNSGFADPVQNLVADLNLATATYLLISPSPASSSRLLKLSERGEEAVVAMLTIQKRLQVSEEGLYRD